MCGREVRATRGLHDRRQLHPLALTQHPANGRAQCRCPHGARAQRAVEGRDAYVASLAALYERAPDVVTETLSLASCPGPGAGVGFDSISCIYNHRRKCADPPRTTS